MLQTVMIINPYESINMVHLKKIAKTKLFVLSCKMCEFGVNMVVVP